MSASKCQVVSSCRKDFNENNPMPNGTQCTLNSMLATHVAYGQRGYYFQLILQMYLLFKTETDANKLFENIVLN